MTAVAATFHRLDCDETPGPAVEDCEPTFIDPDTEGAILSDDLARLRKWAAEAGWIRYDGTDICKAHKEAIAAGTHKFTPDADGSSICAVCEAWATDERHGPYIPGQLELPIGGQQ
jgi:hypothetical protein